MMSVNEPIYDILLDIQSKKNETKRSNPKYKEVKKRMALTGHLILCKSYERYQAVWNTQRIIPFSHTLVTLRINEG